MWGLPAYEKAFLSTINKHFDNHPKDHYVGKSVLSISHDSEIAAVKDRIVNVCKVCFNHCAQKYINQRLMDELAYNTTVTAESRINNLREVYI